MRMHSPGGILSGYRRSVIGHSSSRQGVLDAQERDRMYLVMEYCSGGDLAKYIRRHKRIPEVAARALLRQLSAGLRELWSRNLVHVSGLASSPPPLRLPCRACGLLLR